MKGKRIPPVYGLWLLLTAAMAIFIGLSLAGDISIGGYTLNKARYPEVLLAKEETPEPVVTPVEVPVDTLDVGIEEVPVPADTTVHKVLIFGDSMTHNLAMSISKYGTKNNYKVTGVTWESSSIPAWRSSGKIKKYMEMVNPDFVIISLGANEVGLKNFERRIPEVKGIVEELGETPYVWVGPPLWKEDPGIYSMLNQALPAGRLFITGPDMEIPRGPDHIHPTRRGADMWADTLMRWMAHSPHPILAEVPDSGTTTRGHKFIYLHPSE